LNNGEGSTIRHVLLRAGHGLLKYNQYMYKHSNQAKRGNVRNKLLYLFVVLMMLLSVIAAVVPVFAIDKELNTLPPVELPEKRNPKLDTRLNNLVSEKIPEKASRQAEKFSFGLDEGIVRVFMECASGEADTAVEAAIALGAEIETGRDDRYQLSISISNLTALTESDAVKFLRIPIYTETYEISEGVALMNADEWQIAGYTGSGIKIGVLDLGFYGYEALLGSDLPLSVTTQSFLAGGDIYGPTGYPIVHGTGCAEIVHDIAPDAELYLVNYGTDLEILDAVDYLVYTAQVDIITHSCGSPIWGPGDGSGDVCDKITEARANGIFWAQAAGNSAQSHWWGNWLDSPPTNNYLNYIADSWEVTPIYLYASESISFYLRWDDPWGISSNNYDLVLVYWDGAKWDLVLVSNDIQDGVGGDDYPIEYVQHTATAEGWYGAAVWKESATGTEALHVFSYPWSFGVPELQVASRSLPIPADSLAAITVGAVPWNSPTMLEPYSSQGPNENNDTKPDIVATDNVSNYTYTLFTGTSASAPHVGGAAALVKQAYPTFTPGDIQAFLEGNAIDLGTPGKDNVFGSGRLDLGVVPAPATVTTDNVTDIDANEAALNMTYDFGGFGPGQIRFAYKVSSEENFEYTEWVAASGSGTYNETKTGLESNTAYTCKAQLQDCVSIVISGEASGGLSLEYIPLILLPKP